METKPIVIIGAGISGLTLSILLKKTGRKILLIEKRPHFQLSDPEDRRSFNLTITERGMRSFREIGIDQKIKSKAVLLKSRIIHHPISSSLGEATTRQSYGEGPDDALFSIPRTVLIALLYEEAQKNQNLEICFNSDLEEVDKIKSTILISTANDVRKTGGPQHVRLGLCEAQEGDMQGAAVGGNPKQTTPQRVGDAGRRSQTALLREQSPALHVKDHRKTIEYDFLIGADGAHSKVRNFLLHGEMIDFHINYFSWFYKKFVISPSDGKILQMDPKALHVFPEIDALVVAIPNQDESFSSIYCTQIPHQYDEKASHKIWENQFSSDFPNLYQLSAAVRDSFSQSKISGLVNLNVSKWRFEDKIILVGDAAHAVFPFYGQGMNAALQDCRELVACLEKYSDRKQAFSRYEFSQKQSTSALSSLCEKHFRYLQSDCTSIILSAKSFVLKLLTKINPNLWQSEYRMVAQTDISYDQIVQILKKQTLYRKILGIFILEYVFAGIFFLGRKIKFLGSIVG